MLSHEEQLDRLAAAAPEALPVATVAGDPCYDRIIASIAGRGRYRDALATGDRTLVMLSSIWGMNSLLGSWPGLVHRLLAELPLDSYQVVAAVHPNAWHGHGPGQIRRWLADCLRSGLTLLPEIDGWRTGLIAADVLIGDHGSVTGYGAALGVPTVLGAFADDDVAPGSPIAVLGETAPRLDPAASLRRQIDTAVTRHTPSTSMSVAELVTSAPGQALQRLRSVCYGLMTLPEPDTEPPLAPLPNPPLRQAGPHLAFRAEHVIDTRTGTIRFTRYPAEPKQGSQTLGRAGENAGTHLCCPFDYLLRTIRMAAAVLTCRYSDLPSDADDWQRDTLEQHPTCQAAVVLDERSCLVRARDGARATLRANHVPAEILASCGYLRLSHRDLPHSIVVDIDGKRHSVEITLH